MAKVILKNVTKSYKGAGNADVLAIRDFDLEIENREFVVLAGPSGSGKSTILRMIAGLEEITSGDILIGDRRMNDVAPKDREIAMVFRKTALYPRRSVFENIAFGLRFRKLSKQEINKRVTEAAAAAGIGDLLECKPAGLSRLDRRRIAVGRALVRQPKVFLLDDPLADLDAGARAQLRADLLRLHQRLDAAVLCAACDPVEAMKMGTRIVGMSRGEIQQVDEPSALYKNPRNLFMAGFLGDPPMNFIRGTLRSSGAGWVFKEEGQGTIELNLGDRPGAAAFASRDVILGVHPEDCPVLEAEDAPGAQCFKAIADLVEPAGAETLFHLQTGAHLLVSRNAGLSTPGGAGRRIRFALNPERVHLFDPASTLRIG